MVVKANQLIEAKYRLTATEQKIIYMLTAMVHKNDEDFKPYIMRIEDLMVLIGTDSHSKYSEVKAVCRNLMKKVFTIHDVIKKEEIMVNWFSSVNYKYGKGFVEFEFSPYLKPLMLQLKSNFTKFNLDNVMQLRSAYSLRLYELLKQYESISKRQFDIIELRELIGILKHEYLLYANLKKKVILQAQKEINTRTDIMFDFEEIKENKKVTTLKFIIQSKNKSIPAEQEPLILTGVISTTQTDIEAIKTKFYQLYKGELAHKFVEKMLAEKGFEHVKECIRNYTDYIQGRNINNIAGDFYRFVMNGYVKPVQHKGNKPQRDNFEQREYSREELEKYYYDFTRDIDNGEERKNKPLLRDP